MDRSPKLKANLKKIRGINKVYFEPSESTKLEYPCLIAKVANRSAVFANDTKYIKGESYTVTFITRDSKAVATEVMEQLEDLPYCTFDRPYTVNGLHHYVYKINY